MFGGSFNAFFLTLKAFTCSPNETHYISRLPREIPKSHNYLVPMSIYIEHLRPYKELIPEDRILILLSEDLWSNTCEVMKRVANFVGIESRFYDEMVFEKLNASYQSRVPTLDKNLLRSARWLPKWWRDIVKATPIWTLYKRANRTKPSKTSTDDLVVMQELREQFAPHNQRLAEVFALDLSPWKRVAQKDQDSIISQG